MKAAADLVAQNPALVHAALALAQQQGVVAPVASAPPTASLSCVFLFLSFDQSNDMFNLGMFNRISIKKRSI